MQQLPDIFIQNNKTYARVEFLKPWDKNPRSITEENFERLKKDLQSEQFKPLLILDDGTVLGGNMRIRAYKDIGLDKVWVSVISLRPSEGGLIQALVNGTKDKVFQTELDAMLHYSTRDNSPYGAYDKQQTVELFNASELPLDDYLVPFGEAMSIEEAMKEFGPEDEVVEDDAPEVDSTVVISKQGEVYQLGRHRLMCGDSTKIEDVEKLMNGNKADMVFTDPPYNISQEDNGLRSLDYGKWDKSFDVNSIYSIITTFNRGSIYVFCGWEQLSSILSFLSDAKYLVRPVFWHKPNPNVINGDKNWLPSVEVCAYGKVNSGTFNGGIKHNLIESSLDGNRVHPTQKPIKVVSECVSTSSNSDETVLDLFGGSGSTLIACEQLDRTCYMMELDPKYCDVIRKRYAKFIDKEDSWQEITPCVKHEEKTTSLS